ncbi:multidrug resistance protein [Bacillus thuringiensis]|uniref:Multidrug resistance protein n=2 Tax=Bacillus thuringiensis TaxID=1428 RepID=A0A4R4B3J0_BACTU|nr:multidrug resistance protein [Bacillus thuringiensis]TCW47719.1 multidrug resistance protein [Bacillus thuringiensis]
MSLKELESHSKDVGTFPLLTVMALILGIFLAGSEELVVSPLLPDLSLSFNSNIEVVALSVSIYGISIIFGAALLTPIGDRFSRRINMLIGIIIFILGTTLCIFAPSLIIFFIGRALCGLASGAFIPTAYAFVADQIPYKHRSKVMGLIVSSWSLSLILGVPMGSFVGQWLNWRWTFAIFSFLGIFVLALIVMDIFRHLEWRKSPSTNFKQKDSLIHSYYNAFTSPKVPVLIVITFCNMIGFYGMYTYLGSYLRSVFPSGTSVAGSLIIIYGLGFATSCISGKYADKIGKEISLTGTMTLLTVIVGILPYTTNFIIPLIFFLFIWGMMQSLTVTLLSTILSECSSTYRGRILAIYSLATNLAVTLGSALMGPIYSNYGYSKVSLICAVLTFIGLLLSIFIYKYKPKNA